MSVTKNKVCIPTDVLIFYFSLQMLLRYCRQPTQLSGKTFTSTYSLPSLVHLDGNSSILSGNYSFTRCALHSFFKGALMKALRALDQHKGSCIFTAAHDSCIREYSSWYQEQYPCHLLAPTTKCSWLRLGNVLGIINQGLDRNLAPTSVIRCHVTVDWTV